MSTKQHNDALWMGLSPRFPRGIDNLNQLRRSLDQIILIEAGERIQGFKWAFCPRTSDGYLWFCCLSFQVASEPYQDIVFVFFPWAQDQEEKEGTPRDRSIAVYTDAQISDEVISDLLRELFFALGGQESA